MLLGAGREFTMAHPSNVLTIARAEALFASDVSAGATLSRAEATLAIRDAMRAYHGTRGCAAALAAWYGDHPETAAPRMRWARELVEALFTRTVRAEHPPLGAVTASSLARAA
jgi:hypothetical protein